MCTAHGLSEQMVSRSLATMHSEALDAGPLEPPTQGASWILVLLCEPESLCSPFPEALQTLCDISN